MKFKKSHPQGFTLVELLVVMALLSVLATVMASQLDISTRMLKTSQQALEHTEFVSSLYAILSKEEFCRASFDSIEMKHSEGDVYESCLESDSKFKIVNGSGDGSLFSSSEDSLGKDWSYGAVHITSACLRWVKNSLNPDPKTAVITLKVETARRRTREIATSFGPPSLGSRTLVLRAQLKALSAGTMGVETCRLQGYGSDAPLDGDSTSVTTVINTTTDNTTDKTTKITVDRETNLPPHSVLAFNATACPTGWKEFTPLRGRTIVGANPTRSSVSVRNLGEVGGEESHKLLISEMPFHRHKEASMIWDGNSGSTILDDYGPLAVLKSGNGHEWKGAFTSYEGSDQPHNVMQPYAVLLYCEKAE